MAAKFYSLAPADRQNSSSFVYYVSLNEVDHQITHENHILVTRFIQKTQYARACAVACCALTSHNTKVCLIFLTPHTIVIVYI